MKNIKTSVTELIGHTPMMELTHIEKELGLQAKIIAKLEYFNATGSVKDRIAEKMIEDAEEKGILKQGSVIIEPTSGNTGIGLASVGTSKGYRVIIVMPETMSVERRKLMKAYGAELVLSDGSKGMKGAIEKANEIAKETEGAVIDEYFCIDHGTGIVIGETATIGHHVKLYQGVTIGAKSFDLDENGNPLKSGKRHPDIGNYVVIYANATILGGDTVVGSHSIIGGNTWLLHSVEEGSKIYYR